MKNNDLNCMVFVYFRKLRKPGNTIKISLGKIAYQERLGWENVYPYYKKSVQTDWSDFSDIKAERSNYNFLICDQSAYVLFNQSWQHNFKGKPQESLSKETRSLKT